MVGRPRKQSREEAIEAALELFWARGFESTSIGDLSKALGVGPSSIYNAFGSKEALYCECLDVYVEREGGFLREAVEADEDVLTAFGEMFERAAKLYSRKDLPRGCAVLSAPAPARQEGLEVEAHLREMRTQTRRLFEGAIRRARDRGELTEEVDVGALARFVLGTLQALSAQARDGASTRALRGLAGQARAALELHRG